LSGPPTLGAAGAAPRRPRAAREDVRACGGASPRAANPPWSASPECPGVPPWPDKPYVVVYLEDSGAEPHSRAFRVWRRAIELGDPRMFA
jgi:hypothetical protein